MKEGLGDQALTPYRVIGLSIAIFAPGCTTPPALSRWQAGQASYPVLTHCTVCGVRLAEGAVPRELPMLREWGWGPVEEECLLECLPSHALDGALSEGQREESRGRET